MKKIISVIVLVVALVMSTGCHSKDVESTASEANAAEAKGTVEIVSNADEYTLMFSENSQNERMMLSFTDVEWCLSVDGMAYTIWFDGAHHIQIIEEIVINDDINYDMLHINGGNAAIIDGDVVTRFGTPSETGTVYVLASKPSSRAIRDICAHAKEAGARNVVICELYKQDTFAETTGYVMRKDAE